MERAVRDENEKCQSCGHPARKHVGGLVPASCGEDGCCCGQFLSPLALMELASRAEEGVHAARVAYLRRQTLERIVRLTDEAGKPTKNTLPVVNSLAREALAITLPDEP